MGKMVIDSHKQAIVGLLRDGESLLRQCGDEESTAKLQTVRQEAEKKEEPVIMFYGLYNAGKSTLGNALCNANLKMGDVPTTVSVEKIHWEGYTLIDTPGINAHAEHTEIAENEIRQSDIILFIMDNADTFDTQMVYAAITDILKMGKPLAIVINQKNVDTSEDGNIPVPARSSIHKIVEKVSLNLSQYAARCGMQLEKDAYFLGIYPVNARNALKAWEKSGAAAERVLERNGISSLRNALNVTIRRSEVVYMLRTPLINLRDILRQAIEHYQSTTIYGEKTDLAKNRENLLASRQRLRDRLMADGLRKIEAALETAKSAAANGQAVDGLNEKLTAELNALMQEAAKQEQGILQSEIRLEAMPGYQPVSNITIDSSSTSNEDEFSLSDAAKLIPIFIDIPTIPLPIPIPLIIKAVELIIGIFLPKKGPNADEEARQSQQRLANYYKWLNELRDHEIQIKASYEKVVNDFLQQYYDSKLEQIDLALAEVDGNCAEHTKNLRAMEQLLMRVGDEMIALPEVM